MSINVEIAQTTTVPETHIHSIASLASQIVIINQHNVIKGLNTESPLYPALVHLVRQDINSWLSTNDDFTDDKDEVCEGIASAYTHNYDTKTARPLGDVLFLIALDCAKDYMKELAAWKEANGL